MYRDRQCTYRFGCWCVGVRRAPRRSAPVPLPYAPSIHTWCGWAIHTWCGWAGWAGGGPWTVGAYFAPRVDRRQRGATRPRGRSRRGIRELGRGPCQDRLSQQGGTVRARREKSRARGGGPTQPARRASPPKRSPAGGAPPARRPRAARGAVSAGRWCQARGGAASVFAADGRAGGRSVGAGGREPGLCARAGWLARGGAAGALYVCGRRRAPPTCVAEGATGSRGG